MKVYLAARFTRAPEMHGHADRLEERGIEVTSRWHSDPSHRIGGTAENPNVADPAFNARLALEDWNDLLDADVVVSFTEGVAGTGRGGRHVEFGLALASNKPVVLIGPREHVFHWLEGVLAFGSLEEWLRWEEGD